MINFYITIEEGSNGVMIKASSTQGQFCTDAERKTFIKLYEFLNKEFKNVNNTVPHFKRTGKG